MLIKTKNVENKLAEKTGLLNMCCPRLGTSSEFIPANTVNIKIIETTVSILVDNYSQVIIFFGRIYFL